MTHSLSGKTALVTGGSRGIGRAIATSLAEDGALVAVHYGRNRNSAEQTVAQIEKAGGKAFALGADLADRNGPKALFEALDAELQRRTGSNALDILVNNAGVAHFGGIGQLPADAFEEMLSVNIRSVYYVSELAKERLREGGRVINLSSAVTRVGVPAALAYSASKGWVDSFTLSLAADLGPKNIAVNAVAPGVIETDMSEPMLADGGASILPKQALKRVGQPADIANLVRALAGPGGAWTTGQVIDASGGSGIQF
jgi:3-oxoacyl-[acyl-carrier protein] reductase